MSIKNKPANVVDFCAIRDKAIIEDLYQSWVEFGGTSPSQMVEWVSWRAEVVRVLEKYHGKLDIDEEAL